MLLKKNNREIRFLQLTLQQKIKNSREEAHEFQAPIDERGSKNMLKTLKI